jgi:antibiotic biosynthesis monooxygenase (ABM) superfamily enzyme
VFIRVHRATVRPGTEAAFTAGIRSSAIPHAAGLPEVLDSHFGRRLEGDRHVFVNVTLWADDAALTAIAGLDRQSRLVFDGEAGMIESDAVELYEIIEP